MVKKATCRVRSEKEEKKKSENKQDITLKDKRHEKWNRVSVICTALSALFCLFTWLNDVTSYERHTSSDMYAKANMGDCDAQFFLADYYYTIGDFAQSFYWYKLAAEGTAEISTYAKNNLAILYIKLFNSEENKVYSEDEIDKGYVKGLEEYKSEEKKRINDKIVRLFDAAFSEGLETAGINLYAYIQQTPEAYFPGINLEEKKEQIYDKIRKEENYYNLDDLKVGKYKESGIIEKSVPLTLSQEKGDTYKYVFDEVKFELGEDYKTKITYKYKVYKKIGDNMYDYQLSYP